MVPELGVAPPQSIEGPRLPGPVPGRPEQFQRPLAVPEIFAVPGLPFVNVPNIEMNAGLADPVTGPFVAA